MKYLHDFFSAVSDRKTAVTIGKFDGLHRGHALLLDRIKAQAPELCSVVITFDISPRVELEGQKNENLLTQAERAGMLRRRGIDVLIECPFNDRFLHLTPEEFLRELTERLNMAYIAVGADFRFGYRGAGDAALIEQMGQELCYKADVVPKLSMDGNVISSSRIRELVRTGDMEEAEKLLGFPYFISGEIVHGAHLGTRIGIPTINQYPPSDKLLPPRGVYVTTTEIAGKTYHGITNVGVKPTVQTTDAVNVETNILDFSGDVYEEEAEVRFLKYLRPERKFKDLTALRHQIETDRKAALSFFNGT